jgi:hypothetical protein
MCALQNRLNDTIDYRLRQLFRPQSVDTADASSGHLAYNGSRTFNWPFFPRAECAIRRREQLSGADDDRAKRPL